ncbi:hypothetical protein Ahy_B06g085222 [Arachis hypogaea]|uniref:F-box domain-containing protein n=1 Tax=Arachis hypogaea TaxID=3818 RepID=A0A444YTV9_ARAHY|nr:hypothetical protein Ahy_B06g085222 [Arachis hypogaea]
MLVSSIYLASSLTIPLCAFSFQLQLCLIEDADPLDYWLMHPDFERLWVPTVGHLKQHAVSSEFNSNLSTNDFLSVSGAWDKRKFRDWLPEDIVKRIMAMAPPSPWRDVDRLGGGCRKMDLLT